MIFEVVFMSVPSNGWMSDRLEGSSFPPLERVPLLQRARVSTMFRPSPTFELVCIREAIERVRYIRAGFLGLDEATQIDWQDAKVGLHWTFTHHEDRKMPIRIASMTRRIAKNGAMLHKATMDRIHSLGADHEPSEAERALAEERRLLKEERAKRQARAQQPRAKAIDKLVRTHHPQAKEKPKEKKEPKEAKEAKAGKAHRPSRAEKHAAQAAALQAASRAPKKTAKA
jgi:hypothetical protein